MEQQNTIELGFYQLIGVDSSPAHPLSLDISAVN